MANVGILGAGSWGTALALLLHTNGHQICVWSIVESEIEMLKKEQFMHIQTINMYKYTLYAKIF